MTKGSRSKSLASTNSQEALPSTRAGGLSHTSIRCMRNSKKGEQISTSKANRNLGTFYSL